MSIIISSLVGILPRVLCKGPMFSTISSTLYCPDLVRWRVGLSLIQAFIMFLAFFSSMSSLRELFFASSTGLSLGISIEVSLEAYNFQSAHSTESCNSVDRRDRGDLAEAGDQITSILSKFSKVGCFFAEEFLLRSSDDAPIFSNRDPIVNSVIHMYQTPRRLLCGSIKAGLLVLSSIRVLSSRKMRKTLSTKTPEYSMEWHLESG